MQLLYLFIIVTIAGAVATIVAIHLDIRTIDIGIVVVIAAATRIVTVAIVKRHLLSWTYSVLSRVWVAAGYLRICVALFCCTCLLGSSSPAFGDICFR